MSALDLQIADLAERGIHTLLVQFTDAQGVPKGKLVALHQLQSVLSIGAGFAGPSIVATGLPRTGPRSEFYARGDGSTLRPFTPLPGVARIVGDGFVDGRPFDGCPRQLLRRQCARLAERGWTLQLGIEPEFFLLRRDGDRWVAADTCDRLDKPSYDLQSLPRQLPFLHALRQALEAAGLTVLQIDHEDAHGQYELNLQHDEALASCDHLMLFKLAAASLAEAQGLQFSTMAKPFADQPGSGLHFHVSLWNGSRCLTGPADEPGAQAPLSPVGRAFVAGVLAHAPALCAIAAPTVNSYKRLTVGESRSGTTWAPAYVAQGPNNRTALIRTLSGRFEWRLPDMSCNPYLAAAGMIAAGLDGIDRKLDPGADCSDDLFSLPLHDIRERGIPTLPQTLDQAVDALLADPVVVQAIGPTLVEHWLPLLRDEALAYARHVSAWEFERYATRG